MTLVRSGDLGSSPEVQYELHADQTGGSGNSRTVAITMKIRIKSRSGSSRYGYPLNWIGRVHNSYSGEIFVKGNDTWKAGMDWKSYSWSQTVDVGTTSATNITVGFRLDSPGYTSSWEKTITGTYQVKATNVPPSTPGWLRVKANGSNGPELNGFINERIENFYIDWERSSDGNGDVIYYDLQEQRNGGGWASIDGSGTDTAHQFWTTGGEGTTYYYCVQARDNRGGTSGWRYSGKLTKNTFNMATLTSSSSVSYAGNPLIFNYSGGSNTQPGIGVRYTLSCKELNVFGGDWFTTGKQVGFNWGQPGGTNGCYINWNDLKDYFSKAGRNGRGTLTFVLTGTNDNGTVKVSEKTIPVDIQAPPAGFGGAYIVEDSSRSSAYKRVVNTNTYYFVPDGSNNIRVNWNSSSGNIGDSVKYRVYVSYNNGSWQQLGDTTYNYYIHTPPKQSSSVSFKYMIRALSSFNEDKYSEAQTPPKTLHSYGGPTLTVGSISRTASTARVPIVINSNTSIPGMIAKGSWSCGGKTGSLSSSSSQTIEIGGLSENSTYTLRIVYNDGSGFVSDKTRDVSIGGNKPIMFVNKYGVGVGGLKAVSGVALNLQGGASLDKFHLRKVDNKNCDEVYSDELVVTRASSPNRPEDYCLVRGLGRDSTFGLQLASYYGGLNRYYLRSTYDTTQKWKSWSRIYTTQDKPTPSEIGALSTSGGSITESLTINKKLTVGDIEGSNLVGGGSKNGTSSAPDANLIWKSGFYDFQGGKNFPPGGDWFWLVNAAHRSNHEGYRFNLQLAGGFWEQGFFIRKTNDRGEGAWQRIMTTSTFDAEEVGAVSEYGGSVIHGSFGQNGGVLEANGDFNKYLTEGEYGVAGENHKNGPVQGATHLYGKLIVKVNDGGTHNNKNNWIWQTFISTEWDGIFMRKKVNGSDWTPWKMAAFTNPPRAYSASTLVLEPTAEERISSLEEEVAELKETIKKLIKKDSE